MTAILIKRHQFTGLSKVYSREPDGLAAILRALAIDNARLKVEVSGVKQFTDNSGGTAGSVLVALALPLVAIDATSAGGAQVTALNTSLGKVANVGKVMTGTINEASALLGLPASSSASGAQATADTIPALDLTPTSASGSTAATFASTVASLRVAKDNLARIANGMNAVLAAVGASKVSAAILGPHALDLALIAIPAVVGSAPTAAVKKADVDAFLASYANNVATLAAAWNAAMNAGSPGQGALHVVAG
jgi:hypothetical protein